MNAHLDTSVPDPTDFPPLTVAPGLRTLDGSLRCTICGELFDGPVTLNCGHCFCSFCVRTSLAEKQECPACRKTAIEGHLRPNPVMEEVVSAWKLSRPYILTLSKADSEIQEKDDELASLATPKAKKRKITAENRSRSGGSTSSGTGTHNMQRSPANSRRIRRDPCVDFFNKIPTSEAEEDEMSEPNVNPRPDDLVKCPICTRRVKYRTINQHMDQGCKDADSGRPTSTMSDWKKLMAGPNKGKHKDTSDETDNDPLPKASYATLKDKKLKELLTEQGLPTTGDRNQWIHRHQRWVMIFNANLDKSAKNRKSKIELKKELRKWEEEKAKRRKTTVEDTAAHERRHRDEFTQLVNAARPRGDDKDKGTSKAVAAKRALLAERSNSDIVISLSDKSRGETPAHADGGQEEGVIVVDSEEERELVLPTRRH